ncbi:hypothetical protein EPUS_02848 [Endocarpon pusillum Z07020]|uniref:EKC/KEOPS complex subunit CGI121 n=1 Tax=Endocarpon pusillum (strain Z07020 / HMAS-L-300199) TaxID=1263415 RepID=U1GL11_ENDPU|nr:uncharacterized protein EPUS_02848 [Endocarpon pusillum Z07020]ERF72566.1 hypothetical protein EPUS_02848 [Endocarpon pusillum Z07020]
MLETVHLAHLPPDLPVYIALFYGVQNIPFLRHQLLASNSDFEYAFIDASLILSRTHVLAACFRALNDYLCGRLKSRNVHSEIVFALSPNNTRLFVYPINPWVGGQILEAFRTFGMQGTTTNLLVIKVPVPVSNTKPATIPQPAPSAAPEQPPSKEAIETHLLSSIQGTPILFNDETLRILCDTIKVRKTYKIPFPPAPPRKKAPPRKRGKPNAHAELNDNDPAQRSRLERSILGAMALRGAT